MAHVDMRLIVLTRLNMCLGVLTHVNLMGHVNMCGLVHICVGHMSEARSVATWACVDVACHLD